MQKRLPLLLFIIAIALAMFAYERAAFVQGFLPGSRGVENHIGLLAKGLRAEGVEAQVLVTNTDTHTLHETIAGVPVTKTRCQINVSSAPISLQFFSEVWRQSRQVDLIHHHPTTGRYTGMEEI